MRYSNHLVFSVLANQKNVFKIIILSPKNVKMLPIFPNFFDVVLFCIYEVKSENLVS